MKKLLVVFSSVRPATIQDTVYGHVQKVLAQDYKDVEVSVADFREMPLPFFTDPLSPGNPEYKPTEPNAIKLIEMIKAADAVVVMTAEYNYSYTAVLKNAIDWSTPAWTDKPVAFVGYGWAGGARATTHLRDLLTGFVKAAPIDTEANLSFTKEIDMEGKALDEETVSTAIKATLKDLNTAAA